MNSTPRSSAPLGGQDDIARAIEARVPGGFSHGLDTSLLHEDGFGRVQRISLWDAVRDQIADVDSLESARVLSDLVKLLSAEGYYPQAREFGLGVVFLRPIVPDDYLQLYYASIEPRRNVSWRFRGATPSYEEFVRSFHTDVLSQFVVCDQETADVLGHVVCYGYHAQARHAKVGYCGVGMVDRLEHQRGAATIGVVQFVDYVFKSFRLAKVYFEVPGYNLHLVQGLESMLECEGVLRDHVVRDGELWDMTIYSLLRKRWDPLSEAMFNGLS